MSFKDKIAIVTGAGSGIGKGISILYAAHGAKVILTDKTWELTEKTHGIIKKSGGTSFIMPADVSKSEEIISLFAEIENKFQRIDILINNAGISKWKSPYELTVDEWDTVINTNLRGIFLCSREAAKIMRKGGNGSIINISSTRALMSEPDSEAYAASKGGIIALTHALAASLSHDNIRVNCISPGWIETENYDKLKRSDHDQHLSGRVGMPEDIARACLYLTDENNNFINGANIVIDGGMTRKMIYEP